MPVLQPSSSQYTVTTSAQKIIKRAMRLLGIKESGEELDADQLQDGLESLNGMLDTWNTDGTLVYFRKLVSKDFDGSSLWTIGPGCDIDEPRPLRIEQGQAFSRHDDQDHELKVYSPEQWGSIYQKDRTGEVPEILFYDRGFETGILNFWPIPSHGTLLLYLDQKLSQIKVATEEFKLPPGFYEALTYNLAIRLAPEYGAKVPVEVAAVALESKVGIKRSNSVPLTMTCDPAVMTINPRHF